ncbi:MAG TPA: PAS domain S-box protein [Anaerolineales bacterium]|nr:PAS domain S-box protein [Anaerolineales bacterium]
MSPKQTGKLSSKKGEEYDVVSNKNASEPFPFLTQLVNALPEAVITTDIETHITGWNAAAERMYGWKAAEVLGKPIGDFLHTQYQNTDQDEAVATVMENGHWFNTVTQLRKDGARIPVISSVSVIKNDQGEPVGYVGINRDFTREARAIKTSRQQAETIEQIMDMIPAAVWVASDPECEFVHGNRFANNLLHTQTGENVSQSAEAPSLHVRHFVNGRELGEDELPLQAAIHTGQPQADIEMRIESERFEPRILLGSSAPLFDEHGKPRGAVATFHDITELRREEAQRFQLAMLETAEEVAGMGGWVLDLHTQALTWSDQLFRIFGMDREGFDGDMDRIIAERVHPEDREITIQASRAALEKATPADMTFRICLPDGEIRTLKTQGKVIRDESGLPLKLMGYVQDISESKQAEELVHESQSILATAEAVAKVGSWRWDLATQKVTWSDQMFRLFGVEKEGFDGDLNRVIAERIHPDDMAAVNEANRSVLEEADPKPLSYRIVLPGGKERTVWAQGVLIRDEQGKPIALTGYVQDITERARAEMQLQQMKRLYATLSQVNQTIVRVKDESELYQSICDMVVKFGEFSLAWVGLLDESTGEIKPVAANGMDLDHWTLPIINIHGKEFSNNLATQAIHTGTVMTSEDVQSDPRLGAMQEFIENRPYRASAVVPFERGGKVIGALIIVSPQAGFFKAEEELALLEEMGMDISFALERMESDRVKRQWADAFEHSAHGMVIGDVRTNRILACNEAFARDQDASIPELIGMPILDMYRPEDHARIKQLIAQSDREGTVQLEGVKLRKDGSIYPFQLDVVSVRDENGNLLYRVASQQDITERKRAEKALQREERILRLFVEHSPAAIAMFDREMRYIVASKRYLVDYGLGDQSLEGRSHYEVFPEIPERWKEIHRRCLQGSIEKADEDAFPRADGKLDWVHWEIHPWYDDDGSIGGVILFSEVITERVQARESLQTSEAKYRSLITSWDNSIGLMDAEGRYVYINEIGAAWYGKTPQDMIGKTLQELFPDQYKEAIPLPVREVCEQKRGKTFEAESRFGPGRWFRISIQPVSDAGGKVTHVTINTMDITERKLSEIAIRESEERMRLTLQTTSDGFWIVDTNGRFKEVNQAYCSMSGYSREEILSMGVLDVEALETGDEIRGRIERIQTREHDRFETRHRRKDGNLFDVDVSVNLLENTGLFICFCRDITERKLAEREIQQRNKDLTLITALNDAANREEELESVVQTFAQATSEMFGARNTTLYLLSHDEQYLEMYSSALSRQTVERIERLIGTSIPKVRIRLSDSPFLQGLLSNRNGSITAAPQDIKQWVVEFAKNASMPPALRTLAQTLVPQIYKIINIHSIISVPMVASGRTIGMVGMSSSGEFKQEDLERVRKIIQQITTVILRKRAETNVRRQLRRITALNEIDRAISASLDMSLSLDVLLGEVTAQLDVDAACVLLLNPVDQVLEFKAGRGFRSSAIRRSRLRLGQGFAGQAGLERKVVHVPNLGEAGPLFIRAELLKEEQFIEYFGVPLIAKGVLKGVLEIFNRQALSPEPDWLHYLETLGGQAAIAVDSAQLFESMQMSNQELITAYDATITGWSHAMDLRDKETEGHTQRVTELTLKLAKHLGVSDQEQVQMRRGALLHDIGKLGVPDHILLKPGKLTDEEWELMRQHPEYAYKMLLPIHYLRPALDIPYCHHEKWDGTGYPRGLKGEQIPLPARIFAVVDVWDALRSDRPYRKGWATEKIREYILAESGKHFDPQVVQAFMELLDEYPDMMQ